MPIRRSPNGVHHVRPQPGRNRPEWVVAINRNAWSQSVGTGGRNHPVRAALRIHLQSLDKPTRSIQIRTYPAHLGTAHLAAQGGQRLPSYFNIERGNSIVRTFRELA